jgi:hypothetical protein
MQKHYKVKDWRENLRAKISSCMNCKRKRLICLKQGATVLEIDI